MNTTSASPAESAPTVRILVWDVPVRVFHWLLAASFAGAYLTAESERWRLVHVTLGYTFAGLIAFRLVWGIVGTRHARFASFVRGPAAVMRYLGALLRGRPEHHAGHNPAGALAVVALLLLGAAVAASGWATYNDFGPGWLEDVHEAAANLMLALVGVHIAAVVATSWLHRENLVGAMITGFKSGRPDQAIRARRRGVAAALLVAVLGFWGLQWTSAPGGSAAGPGTSQVTHHDEE
jgi:cytochrome b